MKSYKFFVACKAELIKVFVSNLHPVITNRIINMNLVLEVINKDPDEVILPYGKIFQCLVEFFVTNIWDIRVSGVYKILNTITVIMNLIFLNCIFALQFKYIGEDTFQYFPGLFLVSKLFCSKYNQ